MNEKVIQIVALLFKDVQPSDEVQALHDEVLNNCQDRFADLTRNGLSEEEALAAVMESLKGMDDVLKEYPRQDAPDFKELNLDDAEIAEDSCTKDTENPVRAHFNSRDIQVIESNLTFCDVRVETSESDFSMEITGPVFSELKEDGTLRFWQEKVADNLFKGISWEQSFNSFESFGDAIGKLGQNIGQLVNRGLKLEAQEAKLLLQIPASMHPDIRIRTTSGEISWEKASPGREFTLGSTSGDIQVAIDNSFLLPRADISTTSGEAEIRLSAEEAFLHTVSGDISWEGDAGSLEMVSTSGDAEAVGRIRDIRMNSTSGDLNLELLEDGKVTVTVNTVSGDIDVRLPAASREVSAELNTVSGDIRQRGISIVPDAPIQISANTISGDLKICN